MKFDFTFDVLLDLKFEFDKNDYENYFRSFVEIGSQIWPDMKSEFWDRRKSNLIHDFITMFVQSETHTLLQQEGDLGNRIYVEVNDRGQISRFKCYPATHCQDISLCVEYHDCILHELINGIIMPKIPSLCDKCGRMTHNLDSCCILMR